MSSYESWSSKFVAGPAAKGHPGRRTAACTGVRVLRQSYKMRQPSFRGHLAASKEVIEDLLKAGE